MAHVSQTVAHVALTLNDLNICAELTDRLLDATEDGILPESYQLGLVRLSLVVLGPTNNDSFAISRLTLWKDQAHRYAPCADLAFACSLSH